jgi:hypothetical protein
MTLRLVLALALSAISFGAAAVTPITYYVNRVIGSGSVTGYIETAGTIGSLSTSDIVDWKLLLDDTGRTFEILGPLSGSNSQVGVAGSGFSATDTQLSFNYSDASFVIFQAPALFSGNTFWCMQGASSCSGSIGTGDVLTTHSFPNLFVSLSGTDVIASVSEPDRFTLILAGLLVVAGAARRRFKATAGPA